MAIHRGLAYAPYADLVWCETSTPNLDDAKRFAGGHVDTEAMEESTEAAQFA